MSSSATPSLLVAVVESDPNVWVDNDQGFESTLASVLLLLNMHRSVCSGNRAAVIACHSQGRAHLVSTSAEASLDTVGRHTRDRLCSRAALGTSLETFTAANAAIIQAFRSLLSEPAAGSAVESPSALTSALCKSLCFIQSQRRSLPPGHTLDARILVVAASSHRNADYAALMNALFAAQRDHIAVDTCQLNTNAIPTSDEHQSGFLQQAADITGGVYTSTALEPLIHQLTTHHLISAPLRTHTQPPLGLSQVDHRGACFCHRTVVSRGLVCSMCLSVFCERTPACLTCGADFE